MDTGSTTDEEDDEFFEAVEDIASSSSNAECVDDGEHVRKHHHSSHASGSSDSWISKYELWKASPGSITDRRRRLLAQMGLVSQEDPLSGTVTNEGSGTYSKSSASESVAAHSKDASPEANCKNDRNLDDLKDQTSHGSAIIRSQSKGTSSKLQKDNLVEVPMNNASLVIDSGMIDLGAPSPVLHRRYAYANDISKISFTSDSDSSSKQSPLFLTDKENGDSLMDSKPTDGLSSRLPYSNKLIKCNVADKNVRFISPPNEAFLGSIAEGSGKYDRSIASIYEDVGNEDTLCRIKDLDSGKEFVVKQIGKDGMWNRLKELDTGKEITLEEFQSRLGHSPIVQEVMRREKAADDDRVMGNRVNTTAGVQKTKRGWLQVIKGVVMGLQDKSSYSGSDDREVSTERSRRSESTTDDNQDTSILGRPVKIHTYRKAIKEFGGLHMRQQIQAHEGPIWTMKFSHDGAYLASAGQDKVVKVWEVLEKNVGSKETVDYLGEFNTNLGKLDDPLELNGKNRPGIKNNSSQVQKLFGFCENAKCCFLGHSEDILDLSWSPSQLLLSSSMDKTVRLWKMSSTSCLKVFKHNDYVTCIQFHPLDDSHFISGSLDGKVRVWRIQEPQVVDWVDVREMVTAACYAPDAKSAFIGSYKGTCRLYKTSGGKLQLGTTFEVRSNKSRRSQGKKITGFQFIPKHKRKVLITSSDSRIRVYHGTEVISKYKGFKNTKSQIAASFTSDGQYIVSASEGSRVYIWNYSDSELEYPSSQRKPSSSYERFTSENVSVAISWPGMSYHSNSECIKQSEVIDDNFSVEKKGTSCHANSSIMSSGLGEIKSPSLYHKERDNRRARYSSFTPSMLDCYLEDCCGSSMLSSCMPTQNLGGSSGFFVDSKVSATWPEEKLQSLHESSAITATDSIAKPFPNTGTVNDTHVPSPALGIVIVTASLDGDIRIFQNFGLPVRL